MSTAAAARALVDCLEDATRSALVSPESARPCIEEARRCARLFEQIGQTRLVVGVFGGTGVGKSTLINALAGTTVSRTGERRPTTDRIVCFRHRDLSLPEALRPDDLAHDVPPHEIDVLRDVVLLDLPDIDGRIPSHAERVKRALPFLDALIVVTSVDKYADRSLYDALRALPQSPAGLLFVLNAIDRIADGERSRLLDDFREKLAAHAARQDALVLPLSARRALSPDVARRDESGVSRLRAHLESIGRGAERRRILLANAASSRDRLGSLLDAWLPANDTREWLSRLAAIPACAPSPVEQDVLAFRDALAREIAPALSRRAHHASGFPIFELDALLHAMRPAAGEPVSAPGANAVHAFCERFFELPVAIAAREARALSQPPETVPLAPIALPGDAPGAHTTARPQPGELRPAAAIVLEAADSEARFAGWQTGLARRAADRAWRVRQHVLPFLVACAALLFAAAPFLAHAFDPAASGAAGAPRPILFVDRLGALPFGTLLAGVAAWYAIVPLRFARHLVRAAEREAALGAALLVEALAGRFERRFGALFREELARRCRFVDEVQRLRTALTARD